MLPSILVGNVDGTPVFFDMTTNLTILMLNMAMG
jgi:hypothetical protein